MTAFGLPLANSVLVQFVAKIASIMANLAASLTKVVRADAMPNMIVIVPLTQAIFIM